MVAGSVHPDGSTRSGDALSKGKNHFRAAFEAHCAALIEVDAPGPACLDLGQLPFRHAPGLA